MGSWRGFLLVKRSARGDWAAYVEDEEKKSGADGDLEPGGKGDATLFDDSGRQRRHIFLPDLNGAEDDDQHTKDHEQCDDATVVPGILGTAPLESEKQADDARQEDGGSEEVKVLDALLPG